MPPATWSRLRRPHPIHRRADGQRPRGGERAERGQGRTTIVEVEVDKADKGKLIGKSGRNIDAVRAVVRAAGLRGHERVQVELAGRR